MREARPTVNLAARIKANNNVFHNLNELLEMKGLWLLDLFTDLIFIIIFFLQRERYGAEFCMNIAFPNG